MADSNEIIDANDDATMKETQSQEVQVPQQKKKHVISDEAKKVMLANLAKAREAKKLRDVNKYPKEKRARAADMNQQTLEDLANEKARELIEKEKQEKELQEYRQWKEGKVTEDTAIKAKPKKAKKPDSSVAKKPPTVKNAAKRSSRSKTVQPVSDEDEPEQFMSPLTSFALNNFASTYFNIDDFVD